MNRGRKLWYWMLAIVIATTLPILAIYSDHVSFPLLMSILILSFFALSFNLLFGYTGLFSFGQAGFYGTGAYVFIFILQTNGIFSSNIFFPILGALAASVVVAFVIGYFVIGHEEIYFAMLTLAFSMILNKFATEYLGGGTGYGAPTTEIDLLVYSFSIYDSLQLYYLVAISVIIFSYTMWRVVNSPFGRVLVGIRSNQQRSQSLGNDVDAFKLYSFVLSGGLGGMAGILFAMQNFVVTPTALHWSKSLEPAIATLIGGYGSFVGPLVGSFIFILLEEILGPIFSGWEILLGIILIGIVLLSPAGFSNFIVKKLAYGVDILKSKLFQR